MSPKLPPIAVNVQTIKATTRKLKVKWSAESASDLNSFYGYGGRHRLTSVEATNKLFHVAFKFTEMFPVGSIVHLDEDRILGLKKSGHSNLMQVRVTSDAVVLIDKGSVAFLCSESKDDADFYYIDDTLEYQAVLKEVENNE